jgi:hypothetical protein
MTKDDFDAMIGGSVSPAELKVASKTDTVLCKTLILK